MLSDQQKKYCEDSAWDFSGLKALFLNCTLKKSPEKSHTQGLMDIAIAIMQANDIKTETIRPVDFDLAPGVMPDMREHGFDKDDWPDLYKKLEAADMLIIGTPIWLGERSSVCSQLIERLYANSAELNDRGQYAYYGKVAGCVITGNEDGVKHCAMNILYALQHIGCVVPPQADCGWIGAVGPGPSYLDEESDGPSNDFTNRNTTFMTWNQMHMARMLRDEGGFPAHGNRREEWEAGCDLGFPNPEYR